MKATIGLDVFFLSIIFFCLLTTFCTATTTQAPTEHTMDNIPVTTEESVNPVTTEESVNPVTTEESVNPVTTEESVNPVTTEESVNQKEPITDSEEPTTPSDRSDITSSTEAQIELEELTPSSINDDEELTTVAESPVTQVPVSVTEHQGIEDTDSEQSSNTEQFPDTTQNTVNPAEEDIQFDEDLRFSNIPRKQIGSQYDLSNEQQPDELGIQNSKEETVDAPQVSVDEGIETPGVSRSDVVDYTGWTILLVEGFQKWTPEAGQRTAGDSVTERERLDSPVPPTTDVYPLAELEEHPLMRVLQEHQQQGFFHIAVAPSALREVTDSLIAKGLRVEDMNKDLGSMITRSTDPTFRKLLPKGEVSFDSYMTLQQIEDYIFEFAARHPQVVTRSVIGQSVEGRDIHMLTLSLGGKKTRTTRDIKLNDEEIGRQLIRPQEEYPSETPIEQTMDTLSSMIAVNHQKLVEDHMNRQLEMIKKRKEEAERIAQLSANQQTLPNTFEVELSTTTTQKNDAQETNEIINKNQNTRYEEPEKSQKDHQNASYLDNSVNNIPYDTPIIKSNGSIENTYKTLQDIIELELDSSEYFQLDYMDQPEAVQLTYKVLQQIINYDSENPIRGRRIGRSYDPYNNIDSRITKSLNISEIISANVNSSSQVSIESLIIKAEADIFFLLQTYIPKDHFHNATVTNSIKKSIARIVELLPTNGSLTEDNVNEISDQIDLEVSSAVSKHAKHLLIKLVHLLMKGIISPNNIAVKNADASSTEDSENDDTDSNISSSAAAVVEDETTVNINTEGVPTRIQKPVTTKGAGKPVIFIDGGIHAREWVSPAFLMFILEQLVGNTELLLGAEWMIVPVLNPDGYLHSWTKDRMWRKNRAKGFGCQGVDLNRNFGHKFGGAGTSTRRCSEIYRGPRAFSEPESQALQRAIGKVKNRLQAYVSVHSYGQMILHPWGYSPAKDHKNHHQMTSMGKGMAAAIKRVHGKKYVVGTAARILYAAAGGSDDWVSSLGVPYSFTMELRDKGANGFVLPASQITPTVTESWAAIEYLGNKIIRENPRSASASDQTEENGQTNSFNHLLGASTSGSNQQYQPVSVYPNAPLVPLFPGILANPVSSGPILYSNILPTISHDQTQNVHFLQPFSSHSSPQYVSPQQQHFIPIASQHNFDFNAVRNVYPNEYHPNVQVSLYGSNPDPYSMPLVPLQPKMYTGDLLPVGSSNAQLVPTSVYQNPQPHLSQNSYDINYVHPTYDDYNTEYLSSDYLNTPFPAESSHMHDDSILLAHGNQNIRYSNPANSNHQTEFNNNKSPTFSHFHNFQPNLTPYHQGIHSPNQQSEFSPMLNSFGIFGSSEEYEAEDRMYTNQPRFRNRFQSQENLGDFLGLFGFNH